ncbi:MAG: hypothetical protein ACKORJ_04380, partial [Bacteroidota bacterium]
MKLLLRTLLGLFLVFSFVQCTEKKQSAEKPFNTHEHLVRFFLEWRKFNRPEMIEGVPVFCPGASDSQSK